MIKTRPTAGDDALPAELDYLRAAVEALPVGLVVATADLEVLLSNRAFDLTVGQRLLQVRATDFEAAGVAFLSPDGYPLPPDQWAMRRTLKDGLPVTDQLIRVVTGSRDALVLASAQPLFHPGEPTPYAALGTFTDVTRRRAAEAALQESESHFRLLAENSTDVITRHGADGICLYASPSLRDLVGRESSELEGRPAPDFVHEQDRQVLRAAFLTLLRSGEVSTVRYRMSHVDGRWVWVETVMRAVRSAGRVLELQSATRDVTARVDTEHRLARLALGDPLTGLANRAALHQHLEDLLSDGSALALLYLDLDRFKVVNDSLGHSAGDELLRTAAARLAGTCRDGDLVARLGGDEFVLVAGGLDQDGAVLLAARVQRALSVPTCVAGHELVMSASVGIVVQDASVPGGLPARDAERLLRDADVSMYEAKARGRARAVVWSAASGQDAVARLTVEQELRRALETGQLVVHYQPQVELRGGWVVGVEALVRWNHPTRGLLTPTDFLGIADDAGMVVELGRQVLHAAAHQVATWRRLPGHAQLSLSVNLSTQELLDPGQLELCAQVLADAHLPSSALTLEVLENVLLDREGSVLAALAACVAQGIRLALDDFGTGSSSLLHLRRLPVATVKIDRAFVAGLGRCREDEAIVRALLSLTSDLGLDCVAEGVEDEVQQTWLVAQGVTVAQGFLLHRPLPAHEVDALLTMAARPPVRG